MKNRRLLRANTPFRCLFLPGSGLSDTTRGTAAPDNHLKAGNLIQNPVKPSEQLRLHF